MEKILKAVCNMLFRIIQRVWRLHRLGSAVVLYNSV